MVRFSADRAIGPDSKFYEAVRNKMAGFNESKASFARRIGVHQATFNNWMHGDPAKRTIPDDKFHTRLAEVLGVDYIELVGMLTDAEEKMELARAAARVEKAVANIDYDETAPQRPMDLEVRGKGSAGDDGSFEFNVGIVDWVERPPSLVGVPGAYAIEVDGESMVPAVKPGWIVMVNPHRAKKAEDNVVAQIAVSPNEPAHAYIKEFVKETPTKLILRQYNPPKDLEFPRERVVSVHKIVFIKSN